jgi:hypothetical protein
MLIGIVAEPLDVLELLLLEKLLNKTEDGCVKLLKVLMQKKNMFIVQEYWKTTW